VESSPPEFLADLPLATGLTYNPATVIEAVNRLAAIGMEGALEALRNALASGASVEGALLVARVVFVPVDEATPLPSLELGRADVDEAKAAAHFPLFPIALQGDIPFLMVAGYYMGGETDPSRYLSWCDEHCRMREPLRPDDDPLGAAAALCTSDEWAALELPPSHVEMIRDQAARLADSRQ
jgi:hypothetical protein